MLSTLSCIPVWLLNWLPRLSIVEVSISITFKHFLAQKSSRHDLFDCRSVKKKLDCDEEQTLTYLLTIWRLAFLHRRSPHRQASVTSSLSAWVSPSKRRPTDVVFGEEKKRISWLCLSKASRAGRLRTKADRCKDWTKTWRKPRTPIRLLRNGYDSDHDVTCIRAIHVRGRERSACSNIMQAAIFSRYASLGSIHFQARRSLHVHVMSSAKVNCAACTCSSC